MNIVAVIVTCNRVRKLQRAYQALCRQPLAGIVIVNNASTDGTEEWLRSLQNPKLAYINKSENTGGAGGFCEGLGYAIRNYDSDWILCFDDDAYPEEGTINKFLNSNYPYDAGGVVSAVFTPSGKICEMNRPSIDPFSDWRIGVQILKVGTAAFHIASKHYRSIHQIDVDAGSFVGLFLRTELMKQKKIGLPRKELFLYGDDTIFTMLLVRAGYRLVFDPTLVFIHDAETFTDKQTYGQLWKIYYSCRNGLEIYRIVSGNFFPIVALIKLFVWFGKFRFYRDKRTYLRMLWHGYWDGLIKKFDRPHQAVKALEKGPKRR